MEKLLHERLREFASEQWECPMRNFSICESYAPFIDLTKNEAQALADEIERYYIPRPRDNKGIPFIEDETVWAVDPEMGGSAEIVRLNADFLYVYWDNDIFDWVDACDMQHEKPQSKVFDPDGVEIKIGDIVWVEDRLTQRKVVDFYGEYVICQIDGCDGEQFLPSCLTHKEPVLDANGKLIEAGCMPYSTFSGRQRAEVESVHRAGEKNKYGDVIDEPFVCYVESCGNGKEWDFTRTIVVDPPDSLEKLRDDMKAWLEDPLMEAEGITIGKWCDRLSALIEKDT